MSSVGIRMNGAPNGPTASLPAELLEVLNQAYFLHLLATNPAKVLPPGKSLLSMMTRPSTRPRYPGGTDGDQNFSALHDKVEDFVHKAFWDEALQSLSSPLPSSQIPRLKLLHSDLLTALTPLLPPNHPTLQTLSAPLPPTSSPLHSSLALLKEVLMSLKERCAPARDSDIDAIVRTLDQPPPLHIDSPSSLPNTHTPQLPLAHLIISTIKSTLSLAETMKSDLNRFVVGSMTEAQLRNDIVQQAKIQEREIVLDIWGDEKQSGNERIRRSWVQWVATQSQELQIETGPNGRWILRLVEALGSTAPVSCNFPASVTSAPSPPHSPGEQSDEIDVSPPPDLKSIHNPLPPQFFFTATTLLYIQNYLQALIIAASLRSLTRLPPPPDHKSPSSPTTGISDFMQRIWTLLRAEIDEGEASSSDTKLVNLADEVVRARRLSSTTGSSAIDLEEEARLRAAVERTLQSHDPVFLLLQKRLMGAVARCLVQSAPYPAPANGYAPERMRTGRANGEGLGERPQWGFSVGEVGGSEIDERVVKSVGVVKGFEDPVLVGGIREVFGNLTRCVGWVEGVWGDFTDLA